MFKALFYLILTKIFFVITIYTELVSVHFIRYLQNSRQKFVIFALDFINWFIIILSVQFTSCLHWRPNGHSQGNFFEIFQFSTPLALITHLNLSKPIRNQINNAFHTLTINFRQIIKKPKVIVKNQVPNFWRKKL